MLQLMNKAVAGDLKAINALFVWITGLGTFEQVDTANPIARESDLLVMASIVRRIREPEKRQPEDETHNSRREGHASRKLHE